MYILTQVWWYLLLAFLLGALVGYLIWRVCDKPMLQSRFERSRKVMADRVAFLEAERDQHAGAATDKVLRPKI
jgi:uncharacterized membrane-anchored protein YhcB (DUF1043 family)